MVTTRWNSGIICYHSVQKYSTYYEGGNTQLLCLLRGWVRGLNQSSCRCRRTSVVRIWCCLSILSAVRQTDLWAEVNWNWFEFELDRWFEFKHVSCLPMSCVVTFSHHQTRSLTYMLLTSQPFYASWLNSENKISGDLKNGRHGNRIFSDGRITTIFVSFIVFQV